MFTCPLTRLLNEKCLVTPPDACHCPGRLPASSVSQGQPRAAERNPTGEQRARWPRGSRAPLSAALASWVQGQLLRAPGLAGDGLCPCWGEAGRKGGRAWRGGPGVVTDYPGLGLPESVLGRLFCIILFPFEHEGSTTGYQAKVGPVSEAAANSARWHQFATRD